MRLEKTVRRCLPATVAVALGLGAGGVTAAWSTADPRPVTVERRAVLDATHLPPLLTRASEQVVLAYDVHCAPADVESADEGCAVRGSVFVRGLGDPSFAELALGRGSPAVGRQLAAVVPRELAKNRGIEYFAVIEAPDLGERVLLPAGGAAAPHVSRPLGTAVDVALGRHAFGSRRRPDARIATAGWGDAAGQAGLEPGKGLGPSGASAFDVDSRGNVVILDQVHRRLLRWSDGNAAPTHVPVSVNGTLADMAVADDGSIFVLETTAPPGRNPLVKRFDEGGRELEAIESAERTPSQIRIDDRGPVVLGRPSHQWMPLVVHGVPATAQGQLEGGRPSRRFAGGKEIVVLRHGNEIRVAVVAGRAVTRSWRLTSETPLAEVQLAEPWGERVVIVVRVYEDASDEFIALVLDRHGLVDRFALDPVDWAETAPLGRFRLVGRSLYRLGSSPSGVFVDRFDLEVR